MNTDEKRLRPAVQPITKIRSTIRRIVQDVAGEHLTGALLFGSRARGDERPDSDWDVAVMVREAADSTAIGKRLTAALSAEPTLWDEIVQPIVLRPSDLPAAWSLVRNLEEEAIAL